MTARFDGKTYDPQLDHDRLSTQLGRVWAALDAARVRAEWLTLRQLSERAKAPEASVSARLRDLRKDRFGKYDIRRRRRHGLDGPGGTWEYRLAGKVGEPKGQLILGGVA